MEEIIMTLPNVSEAVVIGVMDEIKGEIPVGFITVQDNMSDADKVSVQKAAIDLIRKEIGPVASFKHCTVVDRLPKTRSGKYLRNVIRAMANNKRTNNTHITSLQGPSNYRG
jgi:propionyl-CoA synthetase